MKGNVWTASTNIRGSRYAPTWAVTSRATRSRRTSLLDGEEKLPCEKRQGTSASERSNCGAP